jgi:membrane protein DedA with SNARE-associated domain
LGQFSGAVEAKPSGFASEDAVLQYLLDLVGRLGHWSYLIIFTAAALECAAFVGVLIPGESLMLASGFFAHQRLLELDAVLVVGIIGAIAGDNIGFQLGSHLGREWLLRHGARFGLKSRRLDKADAFFARHGPKAVFFGRFVGFARALVPFVAGASRMRYATFVVYDALGAVLWSVGCVLLGYFLGASWRVAEKWISRSGVIVGGLVALALLGAWFRRRRARARSLA